jgi:hypothetical protein
MVLYISVSFGLYNFQSTNQQLKRYKSKRNLEVLIAV